MAFSWENSVNAEAGPDPEPEPEPESIAEKGYFDDHELLYREKRIWSRHLHDKFSGIKFDLNAHEKALANTYVPRANKGSSEDFTPVS